LVLGVPPRQLEGSPPPIPDRSARWVWVVSGPAPGLLTRAPALRPTARRRPVHARVDLLPTEVSRTGHLDHGQLGQADHASEAVDVTMYGRHRHPTSTPSACPCTSR